MAWFVQWRCAPAGTGVVCGAREWGWRIAEGMHDRPPARTRIIHMIFDQWGAVSSGSLTLGGLLPDRTSRRVGS